VTILTNSITLRTMKSESLPIRWLALGSLGVVFGDTYFGR